MEIIKIECMNKKLAWVILITTLVSVFVIFPYYFLSKTDFIRLMVILGSSITLSIILTLCLKTILEED